MIYYIIISTLIGIWGAANMSKKGNSVLLGFLLGLLLNVVGIIIIHTIPDEVELRDYWLWFKYTFYP